MESYDPNNSIHIALIPLSGFISKIHNEQNCVKVMVENKENTSLTLKVYCETKKKRSETRNFTSTRSEEYTIPGEFSLIKAILVNNNGLLLDIREFFTQEESAKSRIEEAVLHGEGEELDFKLWRSKIQGEGIEDRAIKFARLLVAFANTNGGCIFFGISDEAEVIGIKEEDLDEIDKMLNDVCDRKTRPRVQVKKEFETFNEKIIGIFSVLKSDKIIQNSQDEKYYIRRGSTNRVMRPEEIEKFRKNCY
jgi:hypothetical protein